MQQKKKQQNLQLLDILACNSANKLLFENLTQTYLPNGPLLKKVCDGFLKDGILRILATLEAKTAKISNIWTFCTVILLILHVSKICMTPI